MSVGLSVSICISDIICGYVDEADVSLIIGGTRCVTPSDWGAVADRYARDCWRERGDAGKAVLGRLLEAGKIDQPRIRGAAPPHVVRVHWC